MTKKRQENYGKIRQTTTTASGIGSFPLEMRAERALKAER